MSVHYTLDSFLYAHSDYRSLCSAIINKLLFMSSPTAGASAVPSAAFGPGTGMIFLASLGCVGNETHLFNCRHGGTVGATGCSHSQDASVVCQPSRGMYTHIPTTLCMDRELNCCIGRLEHVLPPKAYCMHGQRIKLLEYRMTEAQNMLLLPKGNISVQLPHSFLIKPSFFACCNNYSTCFFSSLPILHHTHTAHNSIPSECDSSCFAG